MSSFPWLRKGSKTSSGLKTAPIKSAPFPAFPEFPILSPPDLLPAITTLFLGENKSGFFLPVAPVHIPEADPTPPTAGFWEAAPSGSQPWMEKISPLCTAFLLRHSREHPLPPPGIVAACRDFCFSIKALSLQVFFLLCWFSTIPCFSGWSRLILSKLLSPTVAFQLRKWKK